MERFFKLAGSSVVLLAFGAVGTLNCAQGSIPQPDEEGDDQGLGSAAQVPGATQQNADPRIAPWHSNHQMTPEERRKALERRYMERVAKHPYGRIEGEVKDNTGRPLGGVLVRVSPMGAPEGEPRAPVVTTHTDKDGHYTLDKVYVGAEVVSFEHPDYVFKQEIDVVGQGETHGVDVNLLPRRPSRHLDADKGELLDEGAVRVHFPPGVLIFKDDGSTVHGDVDVTITPIDPRVAGDIEAAPARLEGITTSGNGTTLFSFGMVEVEMAQGQRNVQIRPGERIRVDFSVDGMPGIQDGERIPMWHHDRTSGYWRQERETDALVQVAPDGKLVATTKLPHFSSWNVDRPSDSICTQFMLRRVLGLVNYVPQSVKVKATANGYNWSITPHQRNIDRGAANCVNPNSPACDRAKVYTFNAPIGTYGSTQQYFIEAANGANPAAPLPVRYPSGQASGLPYTESTTIQAGQVSNYVKANANNATVGNWCGPLPSGWVWNQLNHFTDLTMTSDAILPGNYTSGSVHGIPLSTYRMRFTYALRPTGTTFVEGEAQAAQDNAIANPIPNDADDDGVNDAVDNCPQRPNLSQYDSNNNGVGDACEYYCYVGPAIPDAAFYDSDADEIDDWCDNNPFTANDSQLVNIVYDM